MHVTPDPNDKAEPSGASRGDASTRVLEYNGAYWRTAETSRSFQKHVRSRLAAQPETVKIDTVDAYIEECRQAASPQDFCAVVT